MTDERLFAVYDGRRGAASLTELSLALLRQQQATWPQLSDGYEALRSVRLRELQCDGYRVYLQFNPRRIVSTSARVDPHSLRERKCFLCVDHLPAEQRGILYNGQFLVLCNPAPILDNHFTISNVAHIEQSLHPHVETMLNLARDLSPRFAVLYNGPRCGASAPDHMHFQAGPRGSIPIEQESEAPARRRFIGTLASVSVLTLRDLGRRVIVFEGNDAADIGSALAHLFSAMQDVLAVTDEPMVNVICQYTGSNWRVIIFPRKKHRPDVYFREGDDRVLISPASIDIGGLIVTPLEKDFKSVNPGLIQSIFTEVSLEGDVVEKILGAMMSTTS
jgi:hypothetical protein